MLPIPKISILRNRLNVLLHIHFLSHIQFLFYVHGLRQYFSSFIVSLCCILVQEIRTNSPWTLILILLSNRLKTDSGLMYIYGRVVDLYCTYIQNVLVITMLWQWEKYHYIQSIDISRTSWYYSPWARVLIRYPNKRYIDISDLQLFLFIFWDRISLQRRCGGDVFFPFIPNLSHYMHYPKYL